MNTEQTTPETHERYSKGILDIKRHHTGEINSRRKSVRSKKRRKAKEILGEGCGGLDEGKCLEIGTNSRRSADV